MPPDVDLADVAEDGSIDHPEEELPTAGGHDLEAYSEGAAGLESLAEDGTSGAAGDCCEVVLCGVNVGSPEMIVELEIHVGRRPLSVSPRVSVLLIIVLLLIFPSVHIIYLGLHLCQLLLMLELILFICLLKLVLLLDQPGLRGFQLLLLPGGLHHLG